MNEFKQLNIKNAEAYELAAEIAQLQGGSLTDAVVGALRREAARARKASDRESYVRRLLAHGERYMALPDRAVGTPEELIGYDENGLPK
jgi:antitoxin VapB